MSFYITIFFLFLLIVLVRLFLSFLQRSSQNNEYSYKLNKFLMTPAEHEFFDILQKYFGNLYYIFPQVNLSTIFNHTIKGQNWQAARNHINRKSIDFLICDKSYIRPILGIELDDKTHQRPDRQVRDFEVERIFKKAGLRLLRFENRGSFDEKEIVRTISVNSH